MIIAKTQWFKRRKYLGWGVMPASWEGWVYLIVSALVIIGFNSIPFFSQTTRLVFTIIACLFLLVDISDVMLKVNKDEREMIHEAKAERNALWIIVLVLAVGIGYQGAVSAIAGKPRIDWVIIIALAAGLIAKAMTNLYLDKKD
jgi:hypothetical protein